VNRTPPRFTLNLSKGEVPRSWFDRLATSGRGLPVAAVSVVWAALALLAALPARGELPASPAEQRIAVIRKELSTNARDPRAHAELALALARRARETSDPTFHDRAMESVNQSLALSPDNLEAHRARIWILLGKHEFGPALEQARAYNERVPDDLLGYALLVDANAELGNYPEAEQAAQWLLDMRPGNVPGLTRAAYLRELFGDVEGALDLMRTALGRTPPAEVEERAWILTQLAHLYLMAGRIDDAEGATNHAMALFPDYHYALANLAKVRAAQRRPREAAELLERRYRLAPHPENLFALGEALARAGRKRAARRAFAEFERRALAEAASWDNANRELVFYFADRAARPLRALRIAEREAARRHDVQTLDALAWALHRNGRHAEARREIERALAVGIREAGMLYRAGAIALGAGDRRAARTYLEASLELGPSSDVAPRARRLIGRL
jgi:tetratricopeptide (TPR) repeat protein